MINGHREALFAFRRSLSVGLLFLAAVSRGETVEELTFQVDRADQTRFLRADAEVWTAALAEQPGFLGKEIWVAAEPSNELKLVIRWRSRKDWNSTPQELLAETDAKFKEAMRDADWRMIRGRAFENVSELFDADRSLLTASEALDDQAWQTVDSLFGSDALMRANVVSVDIDPVYFTAKRYLAIPLAGALADLAGYDYRISGPWEVVFDCADGYDARMPLEAALASEPWLALRDLDAPDGQAWFANPKGPPPEKMGRAYVVWRNAKAPSTLKWPYAVERIRIERPQPAAK